MINKRFYSYLISIVVNLCYLIYFIFCFIEVFSNILFYL